MLAVVEHELAVDQHVTDSRAVLEWLEVGGMVDDRAGIEDGRRRRYSPGRSMPRSTRPALAALSEVIFRTASSSRKSLAIADVLAQDAGKRPETARVGMPAPERSLDGQGRAVGADRAPGLDQRQVHVLLGVMGVNRADRAIFLDQEVEEDVERVGGRVASRRTSPR